MGAESQVIIYFLRNTINYKTVIKQSMGCWNYIAQEKNGYKKVEMDENDKKGWKKKLSVWLNVFLLRSLSWDLNLSLKLGK